jgi:hypothetical protein
LSSQPKKHRAAHDFFPGEPPTDYHMLRELNKHLANQHPSGDNLPESVESPTTRGHAGSSIIGIIIGNMPAF